MNKSEFHTTLLRMFRARIPFIVINSIERARVLDTISVLADEIGIPIYVHSLSHGTQDINAKRTLNEDKSVIGGLDYGIQQMSQRQNLTFVFTEISDLGDDNMVARHFYDGVIQAIDRGGSICVITNNPVWQQIQRMGMAIKLGTPDEDEMFEVVKECVMPYLGSIPIEWGEPEYRTAAQILANMTKVEAENVLATIMAKGTLTADDLAELSMHKDKLFSDISGLEKVKIEPNTLTVAGLEGMRKWLDEQKLLMTADLRERKLRPPRGVLLVGVPGCGKSLSAKFIAASWNLPLYRLDLASIQGQYLGQSEGRLKDAFTSADNASPCVLWIDEVEKGLAGAGGGSDGGTSTRMVGQFLFWLQESRFRVFVVATANDVSKLPPELLRRGRFDEIFFVDLPEDEERKDIINLYINKNLLTPPSSDCLTQIVRSSEGFSGADLESAVRDVAIKAVIHGDSIVSDELYVRCFTNVIPLSKTSPERIESIRAWGRERAVMASGGSWNVNNSSEKPTKRILI